jgi:hypothetical protein
MQTAMEMMTLTEKSNGYRVNFEWIQGSFLLGDYFPSQHENPIKTEEEAWKLAQWFASVTVGKCVNIYVTTEDFNPVKDYENKMIKNR